MRSKSVLFYPGLSVKVRYLIDVILNFITFYHSVFLYDVSCKLELTQEAAIHRHISSSVILQRSAINNTVQHILYKRQS